jgi:hypothetical protein
VATTPTTLDQGSPARARPDRSADGTGPSDTSTTLGNRGLRTVWQVALGLFFLQLVGLLLWSWHLWSHFDLSSDMATFSQAWQQIGTGHLNPYETTFPWNYPHYGYPFYQSHFELLMWPLALLRTVGASAFSLLVVQDLALVGAGLAALRWGLELLERHLPPKGKGPALVGAGLVVLILACPWTYWTASFDFHFQPIATCFVLLAGRDAWAGRRRAWWWVVVVLLCGDVACTYLIALGLAAILTGRLTRRPGIWFVVAGVAWTGVIGLAHSGKGSSLAAGYGYLASHPVGAGLSGIATVVAGLVLHPSKPLTVLGQRFSDMFQFVAGAGLVGVASPLGLAAVVVVLLPNALNQSAIYVSHIAGFQNFFVAMLVAVGTVQLITWLAHRAPRGMWIGGAIAAGGLVLALVISVQATTGIRQQFAQISVPTATQLSIVASRTPDGSEVISSVGVMGRFGARRWIYPFLAIPTGQVVPVFGRTVTFVFITDEGNQPASSVPATLAAEAAIRKLGAHVTVDRDGVVALAWQPPPGSRAVTFPAAS